MDYDKLIERLYQHNKDYGEGRTQDFFRVCLDCKDAALAIETLRADLARVTAERDAAVADIAAILDKVEEIRRGYGVDNADADNAFADLCGNYCAKRGNNCYGEVEDYRCENFMWRGIKVGAMKRLTQKDENGCFLTDKTATVTWNSLIGENRYRGETVDRLAAIEDILCDGEDDYDLDRLAVMCMQRMTMRDEVSERFSLTAKIPLDRLQELVEVYDTLQEFAEDVARQFGYHGTTPDGKPAYTAGGLSTLEWAWSLLGWPDPKPAPECECQEEGCHEWASGGRSTPDGYKWLCSRHFAAYEARAEAEDALKAREAET